jgi:hypothetical protein
VTVAVCKGCGAVSRSRRPGGKLGELAGPCVRCGRLTFWVLDADGIDEEEADGLRARAIESARQARRRLGSEVQGS